MNLFRSKKRKVRHGFIGMLESSKPTPKSELPVSNPVHARQIARMVRIGKNFNMTIQSLSPEQAAQYMAEHQAVMDAKRRANSDPDILDRRVD